MAKKKDVFETTQWYVEPSGDYTRRIVRGFVSDDDVVRRKCFDGKVRPLFPITVGQALELEESRFLSPEMDFMIWFDNKETELAEVWGGGRRGFEPLSKKKKGSILTTLRRLLKKRPNGHAPSPRKRRRR